MRQARVLKGKPKVENGPRFVWDLRPTNSESLQPRHEAKNRFTLPCSPRKGRETPMTRSLKALFLTLALAAPALADDSYRVKDEGGFAATGRFVEFPSRYGWESWKVDFKFGLEEQQLTKNSTIELTVLKRDGKQWSYRCKAKREEMWATINRVYGKGFNIVAQCAIPAKKFAKAVDLERDLVGAPRLVFSVTVKDGKAEAGMQKGFYFVSEGQIEAGTMNQYASAGADPSNLGVLFASSSAYRGHDGGFAPRLYR